MTKVKIEPDRILTNFLRKRLTDLNTTRTTPFIFPDYPRTKDIQDTDYPRVGITILSESSERVDTYSNDEFETINFQIDILTLKGQAYTKTVSDEALGTLSATSNTDRFSFNNIPNAITNIKHDGTAFGTVTLVNTDDDFTTPSAGIVQVSKSTGNINFSAADLVSYADEDITSSYNFYLEGKKQVQYLGREINKILRNYWRDDESFNNLFNPIKLNNVPTPYDSDTQVFQQTMEYSVRAYNLGEDI